MHKALATRAVVCPTLVVIDWFTLGDGFFRMFPHATRHHCSFGFLCGGLAGTD
jgi:hypothetical protein